VLNLWATATPELTPSPLPGRRWSGRSPRWRPWSRARASRCGCWWSERGGAPSGALTAAALPAYGPLPLFFSDRLREELQYKPLVLRVRPWRPAPAATPPLEHFETARFCPCAWHSSPPREAPSPSREKGQYVKHKFAAIRLCPAPLSPPLCRVALPAPGRWRAR